MRTRLCGVYPKVEERLEEEGKHSLGPPMFRPVLGILYNWKGKFASATTAAKIEKNKTIHLSV